MVPAGSAFAAFEDAAASAAGWLELSQNGDGSWGGAPGVRPLLTSEVVLALRESGRRNAAYFRGITWLENRAMTSVDAKARRVVALLPHGDDLTRDRDALLASFSAENFQSSLGSVASGWGLARSYGPSALDTGLALLAFAALGISDPPQSEVVDGALFLYFAQGEGGDLGWQAAIGSDNTAGDPITTAVVLRSFAAVLASLPGLQSVGNSAASFLQSAVDATSSPLQQAHAALALLRWSPGTTSADGWLAALEASQSADGSWSGDAHATAVALRAFAAKLGTDDPLLQERIFVPDLGLRAAINFALGKSRVDAITRGEIQSLTALDASHFGIEDLTGIEEAIGLESIDLVGNDVGDFTPLDGLPSLTDITLALACDPTGDEIVDVADATFAQRALRLGTALDRVQLDAVDVAPLNAPDGVFTIGDVVVVLRGVRGDAGVCGN